TVAQHMSVGDSGHVVEAEMREGLGPVMTLLIREGTLRVRDVTLAGTAYGRVRNMTDDRGANVEDAGPGVPVRVSGLSSVPDAGEEFFVLPTLQHAREFADERERKQRERSLASQRHVSLEQLFERMEAEKVQELNVVLKADVQGSVEVLRKTIGELAVSNDQLADAQAALIQSEKLASMGQLAAGIAHEVNNPLGVVLMYAHLLLEEADRRSEMHEDLSMIAEQADRCKKIVAGLLNFARQNKVMLEPTDIRDVVERTLRTVPRPDNVETTFEHETDDAIADLDADQVVQVLTNLVSNAYAAMPEGGTLTVRTTGDEEDVRFIVSDTGTGISQENQGKIFEPFFTTKQIGKGTGLGLAVTYGIVKMHQGDITVQSNDDPQKGATGTTFTVKVPRRSRQDH
ncbi:MAG: sensor histidine kinase, partial [Phycisphaerae bacterium]